MTRLLPIYQQAGPHRVSHTCTFTVPVCACVCLCVPVCACASLWGNSTALSSAIRRKQQNTGGRRLTCSSVAFCGAPTSGASEYASRNDSCSRQRQWIPTSQTRCRNKCKRTCAHAHAHAHTHTRTHAHMHTRSHAHTHTRSHAHTHTRTHAHTLTCTHLSDDVAVDAVCNRPVVLIRPHDVGD